MNAPMGTPICDWCDEPILPRERQPDSLLKMHRECAVRSVGGGVNHLLKQCTCCGGILPPDPAFMTKREAARIAAAVFVTMAETR